MGISEKKGVSKKKPNMIPMAFCVKENNWNNFPVTILQVKVELAFEFYF